MDTMLAASEFSYGGCFRRQVAIPGQFFVAATRSLSSLSLRSVKGITVCLLGCRLSGLGPPVNPIPSNQAVLAVVEADHGVYDEATRKEIAAALKRIDMTETEEKEDEESDDMEIKVGLER